MLQEKSKETLSSQKSWRPRLTNGLKKTCPLPTCGFLANNMYHLVVSGVCCKTQHVYIKYYNMNLQIVVLPDITRNNLSDEICEILMYKNLCKCILFLYYSEYMLTY